ncbi:MAG: lytic transglycosylase domain-containing protein [Gammaproteobacteria bacterium]|nr:MAG: lytic transglycosylase domain-containing protein [Gammaproteobacteria bacterium]
MMRWNSSAGDSARRRPERPRLIAAACVGLVVALAWVSPQAAQEPPSPELRARVREALEEANNFPDRFEAQVWLTDMVGRLGNQVPDADLRVEILTEAHRQAIRADLPPEMVLAVIDIESAFDPFAISSAGAQGLMQVMPFWREELGWRRLVDVQDNLVTGCTILKFYFEKEKGDWSKALARYNGSVGSTVYSQKVLDRLATRWYRQ